jgi:hypothetical protein
MLGTAEKLLTFNGGLRTFELSCPHILDCVGKCVCSPVDHLHEEGIGVLGGNASAQYRRDEPVPSREL